MKQFRILTMIALAAVLATFTACDENTTDPVDTDPAVAAPTNLKAASADGAVFLSWVASVDENADNFGSYNIVILNKSTNETLAPRTVGKGIINVRIDGLTNGVRYQFTVRSVTDLGKESTNFALVEWSPAVRQNIDNTGVPIKVYATTSTSFNSAVDLYNAQGRAEVISQAGDIFRDRGDLYVFASNTTSSLDIISPNQAINTGPETHFSSSGPYDADNLDNLHADQPPANASYTLQQLTIGTSTVSTGKVYFGRIVRGNDMYYFRMLIKRGSNGSLVQGSGNDRYVEMAVSFQNAPNNPFAKQ